MLSCGMYGLFRGMGASGGLAGEESGVWDEIPAPLASMDAVAGLDDGDRARLEAIMWEASYPAGAAIIREGDAADALFLLAEGRVSVWLGLAEGRRKRPRR